MKRLLLKGLVAIAMATSVGTIAPMAEAKFTAATVSDIGVLRGGQDQFFEVTVEDDPLQRVRVACVTFHRLDGLDIYVDGNKVIPDSTMALKSLLSPLLRTLLMVKPFALS